MKISELIAKLEAIKAEHGDAIVCVHDEDGIFDEATCLEWRGKPPYGALIAVVH